MKNSKKAYDSDEKSYNTKCTETAETERKKEQSKQKWGKILQKIKGK